jgi:hypothetical protein
MKITNEQLKQLIKEEYQKILQEMDFLNPVNLYMEFVKAGGCATFHPKGDCEGREVWIGQAVQQFLYANGYEIDDTAYEQIINLVAETR